MPSLKRLLLSVAATGAGLLLLTSPLAAALEIRLATIAPPLTVWTNALATMGQAWAKDTAGRVTLTVYPNGGGVGEKAILQQMRAGIDKYQASLITSGGLADIDEDFNVFGIPFFFENDAEELAVQQALTPVFTEKLNAKGYHLICWGTGGWVQIFSKKPLKSLDDLKKAKLYASKDDDKMLQWYVSNGFHAVGLQPADIVPQLKLGTGLIDTAPNPPYLAQMTGVFRDATYMLDLHIAPLTGALIMSNSAWAKISPEDQAKVVAAANALEQSIRTGAPDLDAKSVKAMQDRGLTVITLDAKAMAEFRTEALKLAQTMRGNMVSAAVYDQAVAERDAVRKARGR